ncbi:MAG: low molecular weight protein-tyrosine-phosphatase [Hyphomicrobiaceae bacterium]
MNSENTAVRVLFVCLGNICRSPMAEGVFRERVASAGLSSRITIDSAGTGAWHVGNPPDPRGQAASTDRGIDISSQRARQVDQADFSKFDYVIAMDGSNLDTLKRLAPRNARSQLHLFLEFVPSSVTNTVDRDVPDPYYSGPDGFETVLDLIEAASAGLLAHISSSSAFAPASPSGNISSAT